MVERGATRAQLADLIDHLRDLVLLTVECDNLWRYTTKHVLHIRCNNCFLITGQAYLVHAAREFQNLARGTVTFLQARGSTSYIQPACETRLAALDESLGRIGDH